MSYMPTLDEAKEILKKYNEEEFHIKHGEIVSGVMAYFAREYDPDKEVFWAVVGMLHDLDFEQYPDEHCIKQQEIMKELDLDEQIIRSTCSHGYGLTGVELKPESMMEKILYATDELTGLIGACALMRPSKSVSDMEPKSVKKEVQKCQLRGWMFPEVIQNGAEMLGWELDELIARTLEAMKSLNPEAGI